MKQYVIGAAVGGLLVGAGFMVATQGSYDGKDSKGSYMQDKNTDEQSAVGDNSGTVAIAPGVAITPISHASAVVEWGDTLIFADPVGEADLYTTYGMPDIVFVTHRHGDHFDPENLPAMLSESTILVAPQDVIDQLPAGIVATVQALAPGETTNIGVFTLEGVAAYNVRPEAQDFHPQSRGDIGVVIDDGSSRVYFSGDTEGTPEMRALENIDVAFISMNLPFTMDVDDAAEAVLAFTPRAVYPYHFRGRDGFSDVDRFKELVEAGNKNIEVQVLDWYAE